MEWWTGISIALCVIALGVILGAYVCYRMAFYAKPRVRTEEYSYPEGEAYVPHYPQMLAWMKETRATPHEDVEITSFDGLTLRGKYYEYKKITRD